MSKAKAARAGGRRAAPSKPLSVPQKPRPAQPSQPSLRPLGLRPSGLLRTPRPAVGGSTGRQQSGRRTAVLAAFGVAAATLAGAGSWAWLHRAPPAGDALGAATRPAVSAAPAPTTGPSAGRDTAAAASSAAARPAAPASAAAVPRLSVAELLAGHSSDWRVARLRDDPAVLVIEFPGLAAQGSAMNRIAALLEKAGAPRDRVLGDDELARLIARSGDTAQTFYQGHDYDGSGLLRFFALAQRQGQPLNADEQRLHRLLLAEGVLPAAGDARAGPLPAAGPQALITFTATQPDNPATPGVDETLDERRRESVLLHESSHGRFYTRPAYREHCRRFWREVLSEAQRERIRGYLALLGYDRGDEELMLNEAQAFLMHTPDTRAFAAKGIGMTDDELAALRATFWRGLPADGAAAATR